MLNNVKDVETGGFFYPGAKNNNRITWDKIGMGYPKQTLIGLVLILQEVTLRVMESTSFHLRTDRHQTDQYIYFFKTAKEHIIWVLNIDLMI